MKNVSFLQLVLGTTGAALIWAGVKDVDIVQFFRVFIQDPSKAFIGTYEYSKTHQGGNTPGMPSNNSGGATKPNDQVKPI